MAPRRATAKRLVKEKGLAAGVQLERESLPSRPVNSVNGVGDSSDPWGWVLNPVQTVDQIKEEHQLRVCGISLEPLSACPNKYEKKYNEESSVNSGSRKKQKVLDEANSADVDVIIVSSDDENEPTNLTKAPCSKKGCRNDPRCLNYLGQDLWEDESTCSRRTVFRRVYPSL